MIILDINSENLNLEKKITSNRVQVPLKLHLYPRLDFLDLNEKLNLQYNLSKAELFVQSWKIFSYSGEITTSKMNFVKEQYQAVLLPSMCNPELKYVWKFQSKNTLSSRKTKNKTYIPYFR